MRALTWQGKGDVRVSNVPDPTIVNPRDAIIRVTSTAICGSDLHLFDGYIPTMEPGDILGHEFMGEVVEVGPGVTNLQSGDRVIVPFPISCGSCYYCTHDQWALCDNSNPNAALADKLYGYSGAGLFGYSHLYGGYAGGQAEYARVPFADVGPLKVPDGLTDDQVLFLTDIFPTGYMAAENCALQPGHVVAVWGCGPVGQFAIRSAILLGADKVVAIDSVPERLKMAEAAGRVVTVNDAETPDIVQALKDLTGGRGPDACIDAAGMEAHGSGVDAWTDRAKQVARVGFDRAHVLRETIQACGKGGTVSLAGVYGGYIDHMPMGIAFAKGLTLKMGQAHVQRYTRPLLERIQRGDIDPSFVVTHHLALDDAPHAYEIFRDKQDNCIKVVLTP